MKPIRIGINLTTGYVFRYNVRNKDYDLTTSSFVRLCHHVEPTIKFTFFETGMQKWPGLGGVSLTLKEGLNIELNKKELYTLECLQKDGRIRHTLLTKQRLLDFNMIALVYPNRISNDSEYVYWGK